MWTAIAEKNNSTKVWVFNASLSHLDAIEAAKNACKAKEMRLICVVKGKADQHIFADSYNPLS